MVLSEEDVADLLADLERAQREKEATRADLERAQRAKDTAEVRRRLREASIVGHILRRARWWKFS